MMNQRRQLSLNCNIGQNEMRLFIIFSALVITQSQAVHLGEYTVAILNKDNLICNGAIIHDTLIITSAGCVNETKPNELVIKAGSSNFKHGGVQAEVEKIATHKKYNKFSHDYDIAILKLKGCLAVSAPNIAEIAISKEISTNSGLLTGWVSRDDSLGMLQLYNVSVRNAEKCALITAVNVTDRMFCADISQDDRCVEFPVGSPLVINKKLIGIKSFGFQCSFNVFTNVSVLSKFIQKAIKRLALY
ncbi:Trypsin-4 [Pseudolycoriella hygida]|uniref:Trypsin-4 n=1 Tax=Pseudolycoriella hygida TaxID=35572 RepID=A0A9Q0S2A3_9DIPT|nr:Trypsin-4 [Pseudolycoriella hygida]